MFCFPLSFFYFLFLRFSFLFLHSECVSVASSKYISVHFHKYKFRHTIPSCQKKCNSCNTFSLSSTSLRKKSSQGVNLVVLSCRENMLTLKDLLCPIYFVSNDVKGENNAVDSKMHVCMYVSECARPGDKCNMCEEFFLRFLFYFCLSVRILNSAATAVHILPNVHKRMKL